MNSPHAADWKTLYPFESHRLDLDGQHYHYIDEGAGESPLLMVHGNPTWSFYWRNLILAFRDRFRTIAVDHVGCGLSSKPQNYTYTLAQHVTNLDRLITELDLQDVTLLAHDWGGAIALGAALRQTDRIGRIILFNTGAFPPSFIPLRILVCRTPVVGRIAMRGLNLFSRAALRMAVEKPERMTAAVRAGLLAPYDSWANRVAVDSFVRDIPLTPRHPTWQTLVDIEAGLPKLAHLPVQLIWGMRDWCFTPECLHRFEQAFPNADVHRFDDAGHYVVEDAHERIVPLVDRFLETTACSAPSA
jgi:haloalkane dehalogenase